MTRRRKSPSNDVLYSLDNEVNASTYPFYPIIPIKSIGNKQRKVLSPFIDIDDTKTIIPKKQLSPVEALPITPLENVEYNYSVDLEPLKQKEQELAKQIEKNDEIIRSQIEAMATNNQTLNNQAEQIHANNGIMNNNHHYIQQQISAINHNSSIIAQQTYHINANNAEVDRLSQQINESQSTLDRIQFDIENSSGQLEYHNSMLGAFNTLMQNPQYFMHLLSTMSAYSMVPVEDITT